MVGSQFREGNCTSTLSQFTWANGAIALVGINLVCLSRLLSYYGLDFGRNSLKIFCSGWVVVIGWRR